MTQEETNHNNDLVVSIETNKPHIKSSSTQSNLNSNHHLKKNKNNISEETEEEDSDLSHEYDEQEQEPLYYNEHEHLDLTAPNSRVYNTPFLRTIDFITSISLVQSFLNSLRGIPLFRRWFRRHHQKLQMKQEKQKLHWSYIIIVYFVVVCDALAITVVQPFLPEMCENRFNIKHEQVGTYVGIIVGVFSGARFFSSFFIGHLTDRFGRKIVLAFGLLISFIGTAVFGLSPNVYVAILIRVIAGLLTSSISICRAILSDLSSGDLISQRAEVFAYLGASFALSRSFSSSLGGVTASIRNGPLDSYLMACLIASTMPFFGFVMVSIFLPETHPHKINILPDDETDDENDSQYVQDKDQESIIKEEKEEEKKHTLMNGLRYIAGSRVLLKLITMSSIASFCNGGFLLCVVLIASTDIISHGFGFSPAEIGVTFMLFGLFGFLFQVTFFRRISRYLGLRKQYIFGAMSLASACVALPLAAFPLWIWGTTTKYKIMVWFLMVPSCLLMSMGFMQVLPLLQTMIANSIEPSRQGLAQGTTQSVASLLRAFGPFVSGALLSVFVAIKLPMLIFFILGLLYSITAIMAPTLPSYLDAKKEDLEELRQSTLRDDDGSLEDDENSLFELGDDLSDHEIELSSVNSDDVEYENKV